MGIDREPAQYVDVVVAGHSDAGGGPSSAGVALLMRVVLETVKRVIQRPVWGSTGHRGNYELVALCPGCVRHRCDDGERWRTVSLAQVEQWMQQWVHNSDSDKVQRIFCAAHRVK